MAARDAGADAFIIKPFDAKAILERALEALPGATASYAAGAALI